MPFLEEIIPACLVPTVDHFHVQVPHVEPCDARDIEHRFDRGLLCVGVFGLQLAEMVRGEALERVNLFEYFKVAMVAALQRCV